MRSFRVLLLAFLLMVLATACNTSDTPDQTSATEEATQQIDESQTAIDDSAEARGRALFVMMVDEVGFACASCHHLTEARLIGPGLHNVEARLEEYELDMPVEDYILESITHPQAYIATAFPEYPENVMPATYSEIFSEDELNDLVAYILSL